MVEAQKSLSEDWLLWGLLGLALLLAAGYYALGFLGGEPDGPRWVFQGVDPATVTALRTYRGDRLQVAVRRDDGSWTLTGPRSARLDASAVERWVDRLLDPGVKERFRTETPGRYGFESEARRVEIDQGDRTHRLYLGGRPPVGRGFYVRYGGSKTAPVFLLEEAAEEGIYHTLDDVRRRELFTRGAGSVVGLSLVSGRNRVDYERASGREGWVLSAKGETTFLDDTGVRSVEEALGSLLHLRAETFHDTDPPAAMEPVEGTLGLDFGDTVVRVDVGGERDGGRTLRVRGRSPVTVDRDPVRLLKDLPRRPEGWPDPLERTAPGGLPRGARPPSVPGSPGGSE